MLHNHWFIYHRHNITLATDNIVIIIRFFFKYHRWGHKGKALTILKVWIRRRVGYDALTQSKYQTSAPLNCEVRYVAEDTEYTHEELRIGVSFHIWSRRDKRSTATVYLFFAFVEPVTDNSPRIRWKTPKTKRDDICWVSSYPHEQFGKGAA
jgi:hypothetical protein